jgi:hypothetical protein
LKGTWFGWLNVEKGSGMHIHTTSETMQGRGEEGNEGEEK